MCAHNERIYNCIRNNGRIFEVYINGLPQSYRRENDQKIIDLLIYLKYYLSMSEYEDFMLEVKRLLTHLSTKLHGNAFNSVRANIGIKDLGHLGKLLENPKVIEYHKF
jgi:hypothetical protein